MASSSTDCADHPDLETAPAPDERIEILLAVYNGEAHLGEQLDSLFCQTAANWSLIARDDGSRDRSREILLAYREQHPDKIRLLFNQSGNTGTLANFSALLQGATAPYIMFCDQDDVWLPGKIAATLRIMQGLERDHGRDRPLLVHTDLVVADGSLRVLAKSLWRYQKSDPVRGAPLNRLLLQNCATGCSMMINDALRTLALPIPPEAMMHDWWLALVAAAFGKIGHSAEPTLLYRQHGANDIGAARWSVAETMIRALRPGGLRPLLEERRNVLRGVRQQARAFAARYADRLSGEQRALVEAFAALGDLPYLRRTSQTVKFRFFYTSFERNVIRFLLG